MSNTRIRELSKDEITALINEYPELGETGHVTRIVEDDNSYTVYVNQSEDFTQSYYHAFVYDKPLLHTTNTH